MNTPLNHNLNDKKAEDARFNVPHNLPAHEAIQAISGEALCRVNGILGLKGTIGDIFKKPEDLKRGITVVDEKGFTNVIARVIGDDSQSGAKLVADATAALYQALRDGAGLETVSVQVDLVEQLTPAEFMDKYGESRTCTYATDGHQN